MPSELFLQSLQHLKTYWGYDAFRPGQDEVIQSVLDGRETLVLFPTGGGKSLCYQVPATVLPGTTLVISPLVALMQDQVAQLQQKGIPATFINSSISAREVEQRLINARNGMYKLLYCAPERLETPQFIQDAPDMNIVLVAVDEAHCISEWGHDFRPPYRRIRENMDTAAPGVRWLALTASATPEVRADIIDSLDFKKPHVISRGFDRPNLKYWVDFSEKKADRLLFMVEKAPGSGLVYAGTRSGCNQLAALILSKTGRQAKAYHAGLSADERREIQQQWISGELPVVVATNAFGMGIDKPDCRWVIHYEMPFSLEAYYQEAGRAGRDGSTSFPTLMVKQSDIRQVKKRLTDSYPDRDSVVQVYQALCDMMQLAVGSLHEHAEPVDVALCSRRSAVSVKMVVAALKTLQLLGVVRFEDDPKPLLTVRFSGTHEGTVARIAGMDNPQKKMFLDTLLRTFGPESFDRDVRHDMHYLTERFNLSEAMILKGVRILEGDGLLRHQFLPSQPLIRILEPRYSKLPFSRNDIERHRDILVKKLEYMHGYIRTTTCRSRFLRVYFGEEGVPDRCGMCDLCTRELQKENRRFTSADIKRVLDVLDTPMKPADLLANSGFPREKLREMVTFLVNEGRIDLQKGLYFRRN